MTKFQKKYCMNCEWCDKGNLFCLRYGEKVSDDITSCEISERIIAKIKAARFLGISVDELR